MFDAILQQNDMLKKIVDLIGLFWHYENMPVQIYWKFYTTKKWKFSDKKFWYFSYFCSKHWLWVLLRTASVRRLQRVPTIYVLSRNKKNNVYPCKPKFYCIKVGFKGVKIARFAMR